MSDRPRPEDDEPVIPERADDDRDAGWGERDREDDDDRILRERPPHW
ncbi:MAG: hypothetical protein ACLGIV_02250 [Actinomycetes bacterium]